MRAIAAEPVATSDTIAIWDVGGDRSANPEPSELPRFYVTIWTRKIRILRIVTKKFFA